MELALDIALRFYSSVAEGKKVKVKDILKVLNTFLKCKGCKSASENDKHYIVYFYGYQSK